MNPNQRSRKAVFGMAAMLAFTLVAPVAVNAQDESLELAPDPGPSWEETSGYASVEASRAAISGSSWYAPTESSSIEDARLTAARQALLTDDLGSMQEEALNAIVAPGPSWDDTSGYGSVEATRAAISALPADSAPSIEASRAAAAQRALLTGDLGSVQEEALAAIVAASSSWDEMSGYGSVEATRAAISSGDVQSSAGSDLTIADEADLLAQFRAVELSMSRSLGMESIEAPLARGTRAESAVLQTILQDDAVSANSDDRIANALFGDD